MEKTAENGNKKKKIIIIAIAAALLIAIAVFLFMSQSIRAVTMRILRLEGTVVLKDNGSDTQVRENLRLKSGNSLETMVESLVSIGLDETKIVTLNENSFAQFNQKGKKLDMELQKGSLFFDVSKPLEADETMDIRTSTMIVGIRGTSGLVFAENGEEGLILSDGHVHVTGTNPTTGEVKETDVYAGQKLVVYLYNDRQVDSIEFEITDVTERQLPMFMILELRNSPLLLDRVIKETDWDRPYIMGEITDENAPAEEVSEQTGESTEDAAGSGSSKKAEKKPEEEPEDDTSENAAEQTEEAKNASEGSENAENTENIVENSNGSESSGNDTATQTDTTASGSGTSKKSGNYTSNSFMSAAGYSRYVTDPTTGLIVLSDGTIFDAGFYAAANPDVVKAYGTSTEALVNHYLSHGKSEGRATIAPTPEPTPEPVIDWTDHSHDNQPTPYELYFMGTGESSGGSSKSSGGGNNGNNNGQAGP